MLPRISIIVPCYNAERYLDACVASLCAQTVFSQAEVILVDDGSTDGTAEALSRLAGANPSLRVVHQANAGVAAARNHGIEEARGEFLMFVDADDVPEPELAQRLLEQMTGDIDIACCCCTAFTEATGFRYEQHFFDGGYTMRSMEEKEKLFLQLMNLDYGQPGERRFTGIGVPWGKLYRASMLRDSGLRFPPLRRMQDNAFNMRAFVLARGIVYLDEPLYRYRIDHVASAPVSIDLPIAILAERDRWFEQYGERATPAMHRAREAERMRCFVRGMRNTARRLPFPQARAQMQRHCQQEAYAQFLRRPPSGHMAPQRRLTLFLARHRMYAALVLSFRLTSHREATPDAELATQGGC